MADKTLGMRLSEVIWEHAPGVMACDVEACAIAAAELAGVLGCVVAMMSAANAESEEEVIQKVLELVRKTSTKIQTNARTMVGAGRA